MTPLLPTTVVALILSFVDIDSLLGRCKSGNDSPMRVSKLWHRACELAPVVVALDDSLCIEDQLRRAMKRFPCAVAFAANVQQVVMNAAQAREFGDLLSLHLVWRNLRSLHLYYSPPNVLVRAIPTVIEANPHLSRVYVAGATVEAEAMRQVEELLLGRPGARFKGVCACHCATCGVCAFIPQCYLSQYIPRLECGDRGCCIARNESCARCCRTLRLCESCGNWYHHGDNDGNNDKTKKPTVPPQDNTAESSCHEESCVPAGTARTPPSFFDQSK